MESTREFELEKEIDDYSHSISEGRLVHSDRLELVDHFREETKDLIQKGLSPEEAFVVSRLRFGDRKLIRDEFRKTKPVFTLNQQIYKSVFFCVSFVMVLSLSPYISFLSVEWFSSVFETTSSIFIGVDFMMKGFFIALGLYAVNYLLRKDHQNSETYIMILMIYLLMLVVMYFLSGHLPKVNPTLAPLLLKNTIWVNVISMIVLIIYSLYLASRDDNPNEIETS